MEEKDLIKFDELIKRTEAIENQAYILYIQMNAVCKMLIEKEIISKDELTKNMDELNDEIYKFAESEKTGEGSPFEAGTVEDKPKEVTVE